MESSQCIYIPTLLVPKMAPHNVSANRLFDGSSINVSFIRLSIVESRSFRANYTVRYSQFDKRRSSREQLKAVPDKDQHVVIEGLDRDTTYHVIVDVTNEQGTNSSSPLVVRPSMLPIVIYFTVLISV